MTLNLIKNFTFEECEKYIGIAETLSKNEFEVMSEKITLMSYKKKILELEANEKDKKGAIIIEKKKIQMELAKVFVSMLTLLVAACVAFFVVLQPP